MKRKILSSLFIAAIFVGCVQKKVVEVPVVAQEEVIIPIPEVEKEVEKEVKVTRKSKKISYNYYRIVPKQIETFPYSKLGNNAIIDDSKFKNSFYLKADLIRIEKIFDSKSGAKYGKVAGKGLIVSMDDLIEK